MDVDFTEDSILQIDEGTCTQCTHWLLTKGGLPSTFAPESTILGESDQVVVGKWEGFKRWQRVYICVRLYTVIVLKNQCLLRKSCGRVSYSIFKE